MAINVPPPGEDKIFEALRIAQERGVMLTTQGSAGLRELSAQVRARAVFAARASNVHFLTVPKDLINQAVGGEIGKAEVRVTLLETLRSLGYTPEGGFPDDQSGEVPEAIRGTLQDLSSRRRLELIARTQIELMQGAGQQARGQQPERIEAFPAWELVRYEDRREPREWLERWETAGGVLYDGRMIAFKGSPVWGELGGSENFDDALDTDHPPFAYNSGMGWDEIDAEEVRELDVRGPEGELLEDWFNGETVPLIDGELKLPDSKLSMKGADPDMVEAWAADMGVETTDTSYDFDALLADELAKASAAYGEGGAE